MSAALGQQIKQADLDTAFLSSPGEDLVRKTILQLVTIPGMLKFFGPYTPGKDQQRWADYQRQDWSMRQLPVMNVFESQTESKTSDNAFLNGMISFQIFWPANFRRSDLARIPATFKGVMENFFASDLVKNMLDELYFIQRAEKVYGLNEYGKTMSWTPLVEGLIEGQMVPATIIEANYRIDLRSWYRALEFMNRTKEQPFAQTLTDLSVIGGADDFYAGVTDNEGENVGVEIPDQIPVSNP